MTPRFRTYPFDRAVKVAFAETVERPCGCVYDKFTVPEPGAMWGRELRRFRSRCEQHAEMCRHEEPWEVG